jgi:cupin fold WbuC family metalloprotein
MSEPLIFGSEVLDALIAQARATPRKRKNLNLHPSPDFPAHRFLNAMEPDSYGQPHRHPEATKDETFVVLRGRFGLLLFDERGSVTTKAVLGRGCDAIGANVPAGRIHCLVSLEPGSVFMEAKAGPYDAATDKEFASWAPAEGTPGVAAYLEKLRALLVEEAGR